MTSKCQKCEENWKERELDDEYWSGMLKERDEKIKKLKKDISYWKGQYNSKLKRDKNKNDLKM